MIETNEHAARVAAGVRAFPVTLYTFDCGELCQNAEALLNRRGVPFTTVNVSESQGAAKLKALTGGMPRRCCRSATSCSPRAMNEQRWQAMLDEAGYPKTPPPRRTPAGGAPPRPAPDAKTRTESAPTPAPAPAAGSDGGYPKN